MKQEKLLVVLLGWMGSQPKHVQKYADWWSSLSSSELRIDTNITCSTPLSTFFPPETHRVALSVIAKLKQYVKENPDCSIIFHAFSNGGGFTLARITHILQDKSYTEIRTKIKCNVLDSLLDVDMMAMTRGVRGLQLPFYVTILFYLIFPIVVILAVITKFRHYILTGYTLNKTPTAVLYSSADEVCQGRAIESFIHYLQAHSVPTTVHKFHSSPHVSHFRMHPAEYGRCVLQFLASHGLHLATARSELGKE